MREMRRPRALRSYWQYSQEHVNVEKLVVNVLIPSPLEASIDVLTKLLYSYKTLTEKKAATSASVLKSETF